MLCPKSTHRILADASTDSKCLDTTEKQGYLTWKDEQKIDRFLEHIFENDNSSSYQHVDLERIIFFEGSYRGISVANLIDECFQAKGRLYFMILRKHMVPRDYPSFENVSPHHDSSSHESSKNKPDNQLQNFEKSHEFLEYLEKIIPKRFDGIREDHAWQSFPNPDSSEHKDEELLPSPINSETTPIAFFYGIQKYLETHSKNLSLQMDVWKHEHVQQELAMYQRMFDFSHLFRVANGVSVDENTWKIKPVEVKLLGVGNWVPTEMIKERFFKDLHRYVVLCHQVDFDLTFREGFELEAFPFDFQDLTMKFETKETGYRFAPGFRPGSYFKCDAKKFPCQSHVFECLEVYFQRTKASRAEIFKPRSAVKVNVKVSRQYQVYIHNVYVPVLLLLIASLIPIYNPIIGSNFDPTGYTIGLVLALLIFLQYIEGSLPDIPYYTHVSRFVFSTTIFIFAVLIRMGFGSDYVYDDEQDWWVFAAVLLIGVHVFYVLLLWTRERWIANQWLKNEPSLRRKNDKITLSYLCCRAQRRTNNRNCEDGGSQDPLVAELVQPSYVKIDSEFHAMESSREELKGEEKEKKLTVDVRDVTGQNIFRSERNVGVYFCQRSWFGEKHVGTRCMFLARLVTWMLDALVPLKLFERYVQDLMQRPTHA